ncbi:MAG: YqhA family protein, partial [Coriobacteriia bacterium]|nr:YqhA family protein [Coriobacteriia bacterium]
ATRYIVVVPAFATFLGSLALMLAGVVETVRAISDGIGGMATKELIVEFIEIADAFLLATVLYIVALGLYELFVDDDVPLPRWLEIHTLDDLKEKLVGVVAAVLAVLFLGLAVKSKDARSLALQGVGIGSVIAALTYFLSQVGKHGERKGGAAGAAVRSGADEEAGGAWGAGHDSGARSSSRARSDKRCRPSRS